MHRPSTSPTEQLSIHGRPSSDYVSTPPSNLSSTALELHIKEDPVQNLPTASMIHKDGRNQALATLRAMSLRLPSQITAQAQPGVKPCSSSKPQSPNVPKSPSCSLDSTNGLHILAVDDNALNLQLIHRYLLKRKSDSIVTARNGVEAVAAVREAAHKAEDFDVIFMDISMPEMDGFEATKIIRSFERSFAHRSSEELGSVETSLAEDNPSEDRGEKLVHRDAIEKGRHRAYVVALTGLGSRRDRDEAESSGFDNFLTKPVSFGTIGDLLQQLSAEKRAGEMTDCGG